MKMAVFWDVALYSLIDNDVSEVLTASIIRKMVEAVSTSKPTGNMATWRNISEESPLQHP
jgi:hypothetical protein